MIESLLRTPPRHGSPVATPAATLVTATATEPQTAARTRPRAAHREPALDWHRPSRVVDTAFADARVFSTPVQSRWAPPVPGERHSTDDPFTSANGDRIVPVPAPIEATGSAATPLLDRLRSPTADYWAESRPILKVVAKVVAGAVLTLMLAVAAFVIVLPASIGAVSMTVTDHAMAPGLTVGDLLVVHHLPSAAVAVGDVVVVDADDPQVRRVEAVVTPTLGEPRFTLGSDDDPRSSETVAASRLVGTVSYSMPLLGWASTWIDGTARNWLVPVIALSLFGYVALSVVSGARSVREGRRRSAIMRSMSTR